MGHTVHHNGSVDLSSPATTPWLKLFSVIYDYGDHISNEEIISRVQDMDIANDGPPEGRSLPDRGDIFYVALAAYYYEHVDLGRKGERTPNRCAK